MAYTKKKWLDHIVDQNGAIIQQGTPVSAGNLNNLEVGTWNANQEADNASAAIREAIPSGLTKLSGTDYTYMSTNPNKIKLTGGGVAFVNGWKVSISDGTIIDVGAPPTTGEREDLVFLEVWKDQITDTAGEKINSRMRVVQNVDFSKTYSTGGTYIGWNSSADFCNIFVQGGNPSVLASSQANVFRPAWHTYGSAYDMNNKDRGLWVNGLGDSASKTALNTADGYVYAIPLFKVRRRNSSGYSNINPNGAVTYEAFSVTVTNAIGNDKPFTVTTTRKDLSVGNLILCRDVRYIFKVLSTDGNGVYTWINIGNTSASIVNGTTDGYYLISDRPDNLFNNVIVDRDIIDLRHQVSLTGFNYQALLEENLDKLLRGELQTKEKTKMLKTYHGLPKTPIDANTVFYASLDGTTTAEVGGVMDLGTVKYANMATGLGVLLDNTLSYKPISVPSLSSDAGTIDLWLNKDKITFETGKYPVYCMIVNDADEYVFFVTSSPTAFAVQEYFNDGTSVNVSLSPTDSRWASIQGNIHVRFIWNATNLILYINGKLIGTVSRKLNKRIPTKIQVGRQVSSGFYVTTPISDLSISNIDRGTTFATLPADFIAGYARIDKAFNGQRKIHSDAITSQYTVGVAKGAGSGHSKGFTVTQATPGTWASGDTIKVKGLAGSIISGVIDSDTALARVVGVEGNNVLIVDDVTKLLTTDTLNIIVNGVLQWGDRTIASIDTATNKITLNQATLNATAVGGFIVETTASTSSPAVKFMNAGTLTTVTGTWTSLGTNEATFTLGTNAALVNADLQIEYSLNMAAGNGGVPEVYTATLAGEYKGKKLIPGTVAVRDDLKGKVKADTLPIAVKYIKNTVLQTPDTFTQEVETADYTNMAVPGDSLTYNVSTAVNGEIAQALLLVNMVKEVEAKHGPIPSVDKIGWVKANVGKIVLAAYVSGSGPNGNKASISVLKNSDNSWSGLTSNTTSTPVLATGNLTITPTTLWVQTNGFVYYLISTDASNGAIPSSITIDSISIDIELVKPSGYDMLVPENPRRDDGPAGVLLVRKETKEIQTYFDCVNTDSVITYGDFIPYQGAYPSGVSTPLYADLTPIKCFALGKNTYDIDNYAVEQRIPIAYEKQLNGMLFSKYTVEHYNSYVTSNNFNNPTIGGIDPGYVWLLRGKSGGYTGQNGLLILSKDLPSGTKVVGMAIVTKVNNKLYLAIVTAVTSSTNSLSDFRNNSHTNIATDLFELVNRPLIK